MQIQNFLTDWYLNNNRKFIESKSADFNKGQLQVVDNIQKVHVNRLYISKIDPDKLVKMQYYWYGSSVDQDNTVDDFLEMLIIQKINLDSNKDIYTIDESEKAKINLKFELVKQVCDSWDKKYKYILDEHILVNLLAEISLIEELPSKLNERYQKALGIIDALKNNKIVQAFTRSDFKEINQFLASLPHFRSFESCDLYIQLRHLWEENFESLVYVMKNEGFVLKNKSFHKKGNGIQIPLPAFENLFVDPNLLKIHPLMIITYEISKFGSEKVMKNNVSVFDKPLFGYTSTLKQWETLLEPLSEGLGLYGIHQEDVRMAYWEIMGKFDFVDIGKMYFLNQLIQSSHFMVELSSDPAEWSFHNYRCSSRFEDYAKVNLKGQNLKDYIKLGYARIVSETIKKLKLYKEPLKKFKENVNSTDRNNFSTKATVYGMVRQESSWNKGIGSGKKALGLMQLRPITVIEAKTLLKTDLLLNSGVSMVKLIKNKRKFISIMNLCSNNVRYSGVGYLKRKTGIEVLKKICAKTDTSFEKIKKEKAAKFFVAEWNKIMKLHPLKPKDAILMGMRYYLYLLRRYKYDDIAIMAYNCGPTYIDTFYANWKGFRGPTKSRTLADFDVFLRKIGNSYKLVVRKSGNKKLILQANEEQFLFFDSLFGRYRGIFADSFEYLQKVNKYREAYEDFFRAGVDSFEGFTLELNRQDQEMSAKLKKVN